MAFDELLANQVGTIQGYLGRSLLRWRDAANAARTSSYQLTDFFDDARKQFVDNWDTWNAVMYGYTALPTVTIQGPATALSGYKGSTIVQMRLTGLPLDQTALEQFGGSKVINPADYGLVVEGDFDGKLRVDIYKNAPAAGVYRGMAMVKPTGVADFMPLAWIVVVAT